MAASKTFVSLREKIVRMPLRILERGGREYTYKIPQDKDFFSLIVGNA
jgi:hypothetical protein